MNCNDYNSKEEATRPSEQYREAVGAPGRVSPALWGKEVSRSVGI